jgi:hypothetical protein
VESKGGIPVILEQMVDKRIDETVDANAHIKAMREVVQKLRDMEEWWRERELDDAKDWAEETANMLGATVRGIGIAIEHARVFLDKKQNELKPLFTQLCEYKRQHGYFPYKPTRRATP